MAEIERQVVIWKSNGKATSVVRHSDHLAELAAKDAEIERLKAIQGLPSDLLQALEDHSIVVPQDASVFKLIADWSEAQSETASAPTYQELGEQLRSALIRVAKAEQEIERLKARLGGQKMIRDLERKLVESDEALTAAEAIQGAEVPGGRHTAIAAAYKREREARKEAEQALPSELEKLAEEFEARKTNERADWATDGELGRDAAYAVAASRLRERAAQLRGGSDE